MADNFVGEIRIFGFNYAPTGWAMCNGQILPISQNAALFSLLGTQYGGNGTSNFALPNMQGQVPIHQGQGTGLSQYIVGERGGVENVTLLPANLPIHNHGGALQCSAGNARGDKKSPANDVPAGHVTPTIYAANANTTMTPTSANGSSQPHNNQQPFLVLNYCIALVGIFPSRN